MTAQALAAASMTEAELQHNVIELCRVYGILHYHTHDARRSPAGFPDLVLVGPRGLLFRELKTATGRLKPDQIVWLESLRAAGADAEVWRPKDWPERIRIELLALRRGLVP